jgi:signal recognition particle subunit SRP54
MGPLESLVRMLPGASDLMQGDTLSKGERDMRRMEGIICSMTPQERRNPNILNARRRQRIAKGSGTQVSEVNNVLNRFAQMQQMMKKMGKFQKMIAKMGGGLPGMGGMGGLPPMPR